jgi:hypothetical protein
MGDLMEGYTAEQLADQVNDPDCDRVGPYLKNRFAEQYGLASDTADEIETLLQEHGLMLDADGLAVPAEDLD